MGDVFAPWDAFLTSLLPPILIPHFRKTIAVAGRGITAGRVGPKVILTTVLADFGRVALTILDGLADRFQGHIKVVGELLGRSRFLLVHEFAVEGACPDALALDAQLSVARPRAALAVLPLTR